MIGHIHKRKGGLRAAAQARSIMIIGRFMLVAGLLLIGYGFALACTAMPWLLTVVLVSACYHMAVRRKRLTTLGSARWADAEDVRGAGMLDSRSGLILGRLEDNRRHFVPATMALLNPRVDSLAACRQFDSALRRRQNGLIRLRSVMPHCAIFGPTGSGKGVSVAVPFLLDCDDSCVVVDFKGELATLTAAKRRAMGHEVRIIDPYRVVTRTPDTLNPLDLIDRNSPLAIDECRDFANAMVIKTGDEKDPHWVDSAEAFISAFLAVVAHEGQEGDRSLQTVRTLLSNPDKMEAIIKLMRESPEVWSGMLSRMGHQLTRFKDNELGSVLTTVSRFLTFLDTIPVAESTRDSTFDPVDLVKRKMTIYLVLPPEHARAQQALLRLWIGTMLRAVVKGGLQQKHLVHFLLDEAATLSHMDVIDDAVDKYRGYGARLIFLYQSIGQLKKCFPDGQEQTLLSNVSQVFFAVNDKDTAQYVSDRLGEETIIVTSGGTTRGTTYQGSVGGPPTESRSVQRSDNWAQQARRLLKPEEVTALSSRIAITFTPGIPPLKTTLIRYFEERGVTAAGRIREKASLLARCAALLLLAIATMSWVSDSVSNYAKIPLGGISQWGRQTDRIPLPRQFGKSVNPSNRNGSSMRSQRAFNVPGI
jgi:type IV secretion system protein VirD4